MKKCVHTEKLSLIFKTTVLLALLIASALSVGCNDTQKELSDLEKFKVTPEVLEAAEQSVQRRIEVFENYSDKSSYKNLIEDVKILESEILKLALVTQIDVAEQSKKCRVDEGAGEITVDFYELVYRLKPEVSAKGLPEGLELDEEGYLKGIGGKAERNYVAMLARDGKLMALSEPNLPWSDSSEADSVNESDGVGESDSVDESEDPWFQAAAEAYFPEWELNKEDWQPASEYGYQIGDEYILELGADLNNQEEIPLEFSMGDANPEADFCDYTVTTLYDNSKFLATSAYFKQFQQEDFSAVSGIRDTGFNGKTAKGIGVRDSVSELRRTYTDDLYYVKGQKEDRWFYVEHDGCYIWLPEDGLNRHIEFAVKDNWIVAVEMGFRVGDDEAYFQKLAGGEPAQSTTGGKQVQPKGSQLPVDFTVKTALSFHQEAELTGYNGESYVGSFHLEVPQVGGNVPNGKRINENLSLTYYQRLVNQIQKNEYGKEQGREKAAEITVEYDVHQRGSVVALVIYNRFGWYEAGVDINQTAWYYDCAAGKVIDTREYAKRCGLQEEKLIVDFNSLDELSYGRADSVYEVQFFVDGDGEVHYLKNVCI